MPNRNFRVRGVVFEAEASVPGLYVVATPIGNLGDITLRALEVLAGVDAVAAEDTRHTGRLLSHYGIAAELMRYDEHGAAALRPRILERLAAGEAIALVSDAGTPLVSDPGFRLVREAAEAGHPVHAVPGASAPLAALSIAGLPTDAFHFAGFLPQKAAARRARIAELSPVPGTLLLFEAPHRLSASLADLAAGLGERPAAVARELTKRFEEVSRGSLAVLAERFAERDVKGEIVLLVGPAEKGVTLEAGDIDALLAEALATMPASAAAADVARATGGNRREIYRRALAMKGSRG